jgi:hypothetical protein
MHGMLFAVRVVFTDGFPIRHMVKYDSKEKEYDQYVSETFIRTL